MSTRVGGAARLRRRMVERVLTHCETDRKAAEPLLILLRRFATESAREEARLFCDELVAEEAIAPIAARADRGVSIQLESSLRAQATAMPTISTHDRIGIAWARRKALPLRRD